MHQSQTFALVLLLILGSVFIFGKIFLCTHQSHTKMCQRVICCCSVPKMTLTITVGVNENSKSVYCITKIRELVPSKCGILCLLCFLCNKTKNSVKCRITLKAQHLCVTGSDQLWHNECFESLATFKKTLTLLGVELPRLFGLIISFLTTLKLLYFTVMFRKFFTIYQAWSVSAVDATGVQLNHQ